MLDEAEHHHLALGHEPQRLEAAGARGVVFEHETVVGELVEQPLGDGVVGALAVPHAALVAAAQMDAAGDVAQILNDLGFGLERAGEIRHRVLAARLHLLHRGLVDIGGETRRVDVDIAATGLHQAFDDLALDPHHVVDEIVEALIDAAGVLVVEALRDAIRPDQRHLGRGLGDLGDELIFLERDVAGEPQPLLGRAGGATPPCRCCASP